jgi:putative transposase
MPERVPPSVRTSQRMEELLRAGVTAGIDLRSDLIKLAVRKIIEEGLEAEASEALGRGYYQRDDGGEGPEPDPAGRKEPAKPAGGYRNGYRMGHLKSAEGEIDFAMPQISDRAEPFVSRIRQHVQGRSQELEKLAVEMFARGLSLRDIEDAFRDGQGKSVLSKSAAGAVAEKLWEQYEAFATRDLGGYEIDYLFLDGVAERLNPGQRRDAVLAAWGIDREGRKHLLHLTPGTKEDTESCVSFIQDLKRRGLKDPLLVTTDGGGGLIAAVDQCFPRSLRQRCLVHKTRNLSTKVTEDLWPQFKADAAAVYQAPNPETARLLRDEFVKHHQKNCPTAVSCFLDDFEACIAHLVFPVTHRKAIRSTNLLERLLEEDRRRTKVLPHAFGEKGLLKLMFASTIRASDKWRKLTITNFERAQLEHLREELNENFKRRHQPAVTTTPSAFSSKTGT